MPSVFRLSAAEAMMFVARLISASLNFASLFSLVPAEFSHSTHGLCESR
jgi:hypothetical protein